VPSSKVIAIPLELIQPHPKLAFRFKYEVASLADSIKETADENTPNGQINPGRVVKIEGEEGYYVFIGVRRFLALKTLHEVTKDARFGVFIAYVDEGLSELQMFVKAKAENEEERGERQPVSLLELVSGIRKIKGSVDPNKATPSIKRLLLMADRMEEEKLHRLRDAEGAVGSNFKQSQLEGLAKLEGSNEEFYTTAASMVAFGLEDVEVASKKRDAAYHLKWLGRVFPEIKKQKQSTNNSSTQTEEKEVEVHEEGVLVAACPHCGGGNMLRVKEQVEVTHLSPDPKGEAVTMVADTVSRAKLSCSHCGGELYVFIRHIEGTKYSTITSKSDEFREPAEATDALDLRYDFDEEAWQRIADGKVAGLVVLAPQKRKK
jgi:ParB/Sulfiredoxin domain